MNKFMCDGKGIEIGVDVAVRERSNMRDGGFYCGTVVKIEPCKEDPNRDVVFVERWDNDRVYSTFRHCCFATKKNLCKLREEVSKLVENAKNYTETLSDSIYGMTDFARTAYRKYLIPLTELAELSEKIDSVSKKNHKLTVYALDLDEYLESVEWLIANIELKEEEEMKKIEKEKKSKEKTTTMNYALLEFSLDDETYLKFLAMLEEHPEFTFNTIKIEHEEIKVK